MGMCTLLTIIYFLAYRQKLPWGVLRVKLGDNFFEKRQELKKNSRRETLGMIWKRQANKGTPKPLKKRELVRDVSAHNVYSWYTAISWQSELCTTACTYPTKKAPRRQSSTSHIVNGGLPRQRERWKHPRELSAITIAPSTSNLGVDVDDFLHNDLEDITSSIQEKYAEGTFHCLFWDQ